MNLGLLKLFILKFVFMHIHCIIIYIVSICYQEDIHVHVYSPEQYATLT